MYFFFFLSLSFFLGRPIGRAKHDPPMHINDQDAIQTNKKKRSSDTTVKSFDGIIKFSVISWNFNVGEENVSTVKDFIWNISACFLSWSLQYKK